MGPHAALMCVPSRVRSLDSSPVSSPVSPLGVVPDFITGFYLNPLGNRMILLLFLGHELLDPESLVRRHGDNRQLPTPQWRRKGKQFVGFLRGLG